MCDFVHAKFSYKSNLCLHANLDMLFRMSHICWRTLLNRVYNNSLNTSVMIVLHRVFKAKLSPFHSIGNYLS